MPTTESSGGPARCYRISDSGTKVGFISPHSHNFCDSCNRVRLTGEGRLLLCLGQEHYVPPCETILWCRVMDNGMTSNPGVFRNIHGNINPTPAAASH